MSTLGEPQCIGRQLPVFRHYCHLVLKNLPPCWLTKALHLLHGMKIPQQMYVNRGQRQVEASRSRVVVSSLDEQKVIHYTGM